jgi:hypothetical protein
MMTETAPLDPAEATLLLAPNLTSGEKTIKATLLFLLAVGVLRIEQSEVVGLFRNKKAACLRVVAEPRNPPPAVAAVLDLVREAQAKGGSVMHVAARASKVFGTGCHLFNARFVVPALIEKGLMTERKILFLKAWSLTPAGDALRARIRSDLFKAEYAARLMTSDPAKASALAATLGAHALLSGKLIKESKLLAEAMRSRDSGGGDVAAFNDGDGHGGAFDFNLFDLASFDLGSFDAGAFDAVHSGMVAFDAGFDAAGPS